MNNDSQLSLKEWLGTGSINLFGRPFAGKDTQGRRLSELFDGPLLGGGDILRGVEMPDRIKEAMKTGELIPTSDYIAMVLPHLSDERFHGVPLILSSVGRWHGEETGVIRVTDTSGHPLKAVIYLRLSEDDVRQRWEQFHGSIDRGDRHDDTKEILEIRLKEYRDKTLPVIEFYREQGLLIEIDAAQTPDEVHEDIIHELTNRASTSP